MKVKELMLGDFVIGPNMTPIKITNIDWFGMVEDPNGHLIKVGDLQPILLTEEILLKNDFILDEAWDEYCIELNKIYFGLEYKVKKEWYITISTYSKPIYIKYVHEFQHLLRFCGLNDLADNFKIE